MPLRSPRTKQLAQAGALVVIVFLSALALEAVTRGASAAIPAARPLNGQPRRAQPAPKQPSVSSAPAGPASVARADAEAEAAPEDTAGAESGLSWPARVQSCGGPPQLIIALLGVDERGLEHEGPPRTDAIMLVKVNLEAHTASVLSFPRDLFIPSTKVETGRIFAGRISQAYRWGERYEVAGGGPAVIQAVMERNFGIPVERYVLVNFEAFTSAIDALGGIQVDVPKDIHDTTFPADDGVSWTEFHLPAGKQHLDGATALRYARTRHQDDDFNRIKRQQQIALAVRDRLLSADVLPRLPALASAVRGLIRTDLTPGELAALACVGPRIDRDSIETYAVDRNMLRPEPADDGTTVWLPNDEALVRLAESFMGAHLQRPKDP